MVWGVLLSVGLGVAPLLSGPAGQAVLSSVVVVLSGTILTLLIDAWLRFDDLAGAADRTLSRVGRVTDLLDTPPSLQMFVAQVLEDWRCVESAGGLRFALLQAQAEDAAARVHSIASGRVSISATDRNNFRSAPLDMFRRFQMVHAVNPDYWNQPHGRHYLTRQREAINAGKLQVERIMVLGDDEIQTRRVKAAVRQQMDAGISVLVVKREDVPPALRKYLVDFGIVTDIRAAKILAMPTSDTLESFWYDTSEVAEYEQAFEAIREYSYDVTDVYADLAMRRPDTPA